MEKLDIYESLSWIKTTILNVTIAKYANIHDRHFDVEAILKEIADETGEHESLINDLLTLEDDELQNLGFAYINADESTIMLFPVWMYFLISPEDDLLLTVDGETFDVDYDEIKIYNDHWLNVGFDVDNFK